MKALTSMSSKLDATKKSTAKRKQYDPTTEVARMFPNRSRSSSRMGQISTRQA